MKRLRRQAWFFALAALLWVFAGSLEAHGATVAALAKQLLGDTDFRVRTQAALSLGKSNSADAVKPLCKGLDDENDSVRAAAAAALGKLKKGGAACLDARLKKEKSTNVKQMIQKAARLLAEDAAGPTITDSTKYYLAIEATNDQTGRGGHEVDSLVRKTLRQSASLLRGSVIAPRGETKDDANKLLRKHRQLEAFKLAPTVQPPQYSGGQLTVSFEVLVYGYPGNNLQGTLTRSATMTGVGSKDVAKENQLIEALAKSAMEQFAQLVAQLD